MKTHLRTRLVVFSVLGSVVGWSQTNTFPTSGSVGIGTTSPEAQLHIKSSTGAGTLKLQSYNNSSNTVVGLRQLNNTGVDLVYDGASDLFKLDVFSSGSFKLNALSILQSNGNIGIGNTAPGQALVIGDGSLGTTSDFRTLEIQSAGIAGLSILGDYRNTSGEPGGAFLRLSMDGNTSVSSNWGGLLSVVQSAGGDGTGGSYTNTATNTFLVGTRGNMPLQLGTSSSVHLTVNTSGDVGIGTTSPTHKLAVNGTIRAKEIIVDSSWADYVFADDYELASLQDVEAHIRQHRRLPGLPSADEVATRGFSVGEMHSLLLAKIEELTLHVIAIEKENGELRQKTSELAQMLGGLRREQ